MTLPQFSMTGKRLESFKRTQDMFLSRIHPKFTPKTTDVNTAHSCITCCNITAFLYSMSDMKHVILTHQAHLIFTICVCFTLFPNLYTPYRLTETINQQRNQYIFNYKTHIYARMYMYVLMALCRLKG